MSKIDINHINGETIKKNLLSKDKDLIIDTAHAVISTVVLPADKRKELLRPSFESLTKIEESCNGVDLGGLFMPNSRFLRRAISIIQYNDKDECPCEISFELFGGLDAEGLSKYRGFDLVQPSKRDPNNEFVFVGVVECPSCHQKYEVRDEYTGGHMNSISVSKIN